MSAMRALLMCMALTVSCVAEQDHGSAELQEKADQAKGVPCARLSMQASKQLVEEANRQFEAGVIQIARNQVDRSVYYARRSVDCTLQTRKGEKATEIELRTLIRRMNDILRTLDTEDRPYLKISIGYMEEQRDRILKAMFGSAAGKGTPEKKP